MMTTSWRQQSTFFQHFRIARTRQLINSNSSNKPTEQTFSMKLRSLRRTYSTSTVRQMYEGKTRVTKHQVSYRDSSPDIVEGHFQSVEEFLMLT